MILTINGKLPGLNDYTKANRTNPYVGANMKKDSEEIIKWHIAAQKLKPITGKVKLDFKWYEANKRRDLDNICFAKKFILDALVGSGIIETDDWRGVQGFTDTFFVDSHYPRIEVIIQEAENE